MIENGLIERVKVGDGGIEAACAKVHLGEVKGIGGVGMEAIGIGVGG